DDLLFFVGQKRERQRVLQGELSVAFYGVGADAQHGDAGVAEVLELVADAAGFGGAARGVVFGVEVQQHPLALVLGRLMHFALLMWQGEVWCLVAHFEWHSRFGKRYAGMIACWPRRDNAQAPQTKKGAAAPVTSINLPRRRTSVRRRDPVSILARCATRQMFVKEGRDFFGERHAGGNVGFAVMLPIFEAVFAR